MRWARLADGDRLGLGRFEVRVWYGDAEAGVPPPLPAVLPAGGALSAGGADQPLLLAVIHDREIATALGINVTHVFIATFVIGSVLGALAGALTAPAIAVAPGLGVEVDEKEIAKHPFKQEVMHAGHAMLDDGTVVDW